MTTARISRRALLTALALASAGGVLTLRTYWSDTRQAAAARAFLSVLDLNLEPVGIAFLIEATRAYSLRELLQELRMRIGGDFTGIAPARARAMVRDAMENDFERGDLLEVRGWLLPRTSILLGAASARLNNSTKVIRG